MPRPRVAARERAALVGLVAGAKRRLDAERSLDELGRAGAGRGRRGRAARAAGAAEAGSVDVSRRRARSTTLAASCAETRVDAGHLRQRADARAAAADRRRRSVARSSIARSSSSTSSRAARGRAKASCRSSSRSCKYLLPRLVGSATRCRGWAAASARGAPAKRSSRPTAGGSARAFTPISEDIEQVRQRRAQLRERRHKASVPTVALVGYTNAGKTTLFNALTRAGAEASNALFVTLDPLVRQRAAAGQPRAARVRHGRVHRPPAARARRGVPRDARGGGRRRSDPARHRRVGRRTAIAAWTAVRQVLEEVGATRGAADRGLQQVRCADAPTSGGGCRTGSRPRCCISAPSTATGSTISIETVASRARARRPPDDADVRPGRPGRSGTDGARLSPRPRARRTKRGTAAVSIVADVPRRLGRTADRSPLGEEVEFLPCPLERSPDASPRLRVALAIVVGACAATTTTPLAGRRRRRSFRNSSQPLDSAVARRLSRSRHQPGNAAGGFCRPAISATPSASSSWR